jgi:butyrate kinase
MDYLILAINPGSTSTKLSVYRNDKELHSESITHPHSEIEKMDKIMDQVPMRRASVLDFLEKHGIKPEELSCVIGRGGLLPPVETGGYRVNEKMLDLVREDKLSPHASNLACVLADEIAKVAGVDAFIYDAGTANEFPEMAKITGMKEVIRGSTYHLLNARAVVIQYAESVGKSHEDMNIIVAHLGGGITMGAHKKGKLVESLADDNGPFAPERAGNVPLFDVIEICYSGRFTKSEMLKRVRGMGGLRDLLGTSDGRKIAKMIEDGDEYAALVMQAQAYQIAKGIALVSVPLMGEIDAIIITGGLANNKDLVEDVRQYVAHMTPEFVIIPGELEMEALALGALRMLRKQEEIKEF